MRKATPTPVTPEMERAKRNQENISSVIFRMEMSGSATIWKITFNIIKKMCFLIQLKKKKTTKTKREMQYFGKITS